MKTSIIHYIYDYILCLIISKINFTTHEITEKHSPLISFRYFFLLPAQTLKFTSRPLFPPLTGTGWIHTVINFIGDRIVVYHNGTEEGSFFRTSYSHSPGDGRIVVGKLFIENDTNYASVQVDELLFFNRSLSETEITMLANSTTT